MQLFKVIGEQPEESSSRQGIQFLKEGNYIRYDANLYNLSSGELLTSLGMERLEFKQESAI